MQIELTEEEHFDLEDCILAGVAIANSSEIADRYYRLMEKIKTGMEQAARADSERSQP